MSQSIIQVKNLSKSYIISHEGGQERYTSLRDVISQKTKQLFSFASTNNQINKSTSKEEFWALKDVNFDIQQGDRVGIIGRNGAGKSTLLKILSRITEPTTGEIRIKGRVASLLEVGTGFHPELTGRENIYLNGAILGMSRSEIKRKFDEIVDFAEVEKFLDTPVKRYSSGMYVRLAFAVAAHLEPEILVVDEVLAVGDAQFQKKCLGKMQDVSKNEGRTILFVSHNLGAVVSLCERGILLDRGKLKEEGSISSVINRYLKTDVNENFGYVRNRKSISPVFIKTIELINEKQDLANSFKHNEKIGLIIQLHKDEKINAEYKLLVTVQDKMRRKISSAETVINASNIQLWIDENFLTRGDYCLQCIVYIPAVAQYDLIEECCNFSIIDGGSAFSHLETFDYGIVFGKYTWVQ